MTKKYFCGISVKSADTTTSTDLFIAEQQKITDKVKRNIRETLDKKRLSDEFSYQSRRNSRHSRLLMAFATGRAIAAIEKIPEVEKVTKFRTAELPRRKP